MKLLLCLALTSLSWATDIKTLSKAQAVTVNNSTSTIVVAALPNATTVQMYIRPSSTAQVFTLTLPDSTTIEVPSGATLTLRFAKNLLATDALGTVITGTGSAVLQVISLREVIQ